MNYIKKFKKNNFSFLDYLLRNEIFFGFNLLNLLFLGLSSSKNPGGATGPIVGANPTLELSRDIFVFLFFAAFSACAIVHLMIWLLLLHLHHEQYQFLFLLF